MNLFHSPDFYYASQLRTDQLRREIDSMSKIPDNMKPLVNDLYEKYHFSLCKRGGDFKVLRTEEKNNIITLIYGISIDGDINTIAISPTTLQFFDGMRGASFNGFKDGILHKEHYIDYSKEDKESAHNRISKWNNRCIEWIEVNLRNQQSDFKGFNVNLESVIYELIKDRKSKLSNKEEILQAFEVKIEKEDFIAKPFKIEKRQINLKTEEIKQKLQSKERYPILVDETYQEILNICYEWGKAFEKYPHISNGMSEETIRDVFLTVLCTHFKDTNLSATGETFNKGGKTDILVKHNNDNIFVAECKFWGGEKNHQDTIDQLFRYLTWRDSKVAIFIFIRNRDDIQSILDKIKDSTKRHDCCLTYKEQESHNGKYSYNFCFKDNKNTSFKLNVLCFCL